MNATYFETDWIDIQLLATVSDRQTGQELTELVLQNSASAEANGLEVELTFSATDNLRLNANLGWLDTGYTYSRSPAVPLDTEFSAAPDTTYNLGIEHTANLSGGGQLVTRFDSIYTGAYWRSPTPSLRQNAYGVARDYESGDYWRLTLVRVPAARRSLSAGVVRHEPDERVRAELGVLAQHLAVRLRDRRSSTRGRRRRPRPLRITDRPA